MKRIKDYFNKHPKLKRVAKILGVVAIVFSFLFNALVVGALIVSNLDNNKQVLAYGNYNITKRVVENDISNNEKYRFYSINDLTSYDVMTNMYNYDRQHGNFFETSPHHFTVIFNNTNANYIVDGGDTAHYDYTGFELKYRIYGCTFAWEESPNRIVMKADFTIVSLSNTTDIGHFQVDNVRYKFNGVLNQSTCSYFHDTHDVGLQLLLNSSFYIRCLQTSQNYNLYDFFGYGNLPDTQNAYDLGWQGGYSTGYNTGYNEGYQTGSTGMSTNPFNLIRNAFTAIADILNIHVLPNLTLGVLIFTPIIVAIIIVVVRFIRG